MHFSRPPPPPDSLTLSNPAALQIFTLLHLLPPHLFLARKQEILNPNKSNAKLRPWPVFQLTEPSFPVQFSPIPRSFAEKL